jgi:hypothetical protein
MKTLSRSSVGVVLLAAVCLGSGAAAGLVQGGGPPDQPAVTVRGQTYTPRSILSRNMGTDEDQTTAFPPHKVIGNIYYVGTRTLSSFLITTPNGHILINSTYERNVRTIEKSVSQLGFKFADIRVLLGTHAHGDHQEGDALLRELTGAQVMVMREDVPALEAIKPGGKVHPIDRTLRDGDEVTLGGTTLVAHLTAGHTRGCTTWTMRAQEGGRSFNVVFACSYRAPPPGRSADGGHARDECPRAHGRASDAGSGETRGIHRVCRRFSGRGGCPGEDRSLCRRNPQDRTGILRSLIRPRSNGECVTARWLRGLSRSPERQGVYRTGTRPDVETEPRAIAWVTLSV